MANKRFLGLGFTFSATDKGLEKKLLGIQGALAGIASSLGTINKRASGAGSSLGRMKAPKSSGKAKASPSSSSASKPVASSQQAQAKSMTGTLGSLIEDMSSDTQFFFESVRKGIRDTLGKETLGHFDEQIKKMRFEIDGTGKITKESMEKFLDLGGALSKTSAESTKFIKAFSILDKAFELAKGWFADVRHSSERFFSSIGVEFSKMMPEQFKALFGVIDSVLLKPVKMGLASVGKAVFGRFKKTKAEDLQDKTFRAIGTSLSKNDSLQAIGKGLLKNTRPEKRGLADRMKDFFKAIPKTILALTGIPLLIKGLKLLWKLAAPLAGAFSTLAMYARSAWASLEGLAMLSGGWGKLFGEVFSEAFTVVKNFLKPFAEVIAEVLVFGAALYGAASGVAEEFGVLKKGASDFWDGLKHFATGLTSVGGALIDRVMSMGAAFVDSHPTLKAFLTSIGDAASWLSDKLVAGLSTAWSGLKSFGEFLRDLPMNALKMIADGWKEIFKILTDSLGGGLGFVGKLLFGAGNSLDDFAKQLKDGTKKSKDLSNLAPVFSMEDYKNQKATAIVPGFDPLSQQSTLGGSSPNASMKQALDGFSKTMSMDDMKGIMKSQLEVSQKSLDMQADLISEIKNQKQRKIDATIKVDTSGGNAKAQTKLMGTGM